MSDGTFDRSATAAQAPSAMAQTAAAAARVAMPPASRGATLGRVTESTSGRARDRGRAQQGRVRGPPPAVARPHARGGATRGALVGK